MALPAKKYSMTRQEFIVWESNQTEKYEFWHGEVFAMTGARQIHVIVTLNIATLLKVQLRGSGCRVFMADMQLEVEAADAIFYPDVFVTCHPADLSAERSLKHPKAIIEVLSNSTAAYDRGAKFAAYRSLPSLQEYVLIDPDRRTVEIFRRTENDDWLLSTRDSERALILRSLDFEASLNDVFEDIEGLENPEPIR